MSILLFFIAIIVSFIVVRIGAIAFELTGLEWSLAKFQALSCFSGTGFTTRESELIVSNPQRRRIASVLMVLGNAGLVTLIATFANSLNPRIIFPELEIPFLHIFLPRYLAPVVHFLLIILVLYIMYKILTNARVTRKLTSSLRNIVVKRDIISPVSFEELIVSTGGYGVSSIAVCVNSPVLNKALKETRLTEKGIIVLAVERKNEIIPSPKADTEVLLGDKLICFGKLDAIKSEICVLKKDEKG